MRYILLLLSILLVPGTALAAEAEQSVSLKLVLDSVDVDGADFDGSYTLAGTYSYSLAPGWSVQATISGINKSESEWQYDNTGSYRITINSLDLMAGARYDFFQSDKWGFFARGGLLYYRMDLDLDEEFYGIKAGGSAAADDNGFGFYLGGGSTMQVRSDIKLVAELQFASRRDVLGDSSQPFDVNTLGILLGGEYSF
ncbi:MAG: outer membrane beta-barrel protein [Ketobacter sp.]